MPARPAATRCLLTGRRLAASPPCAADGIENPEQAVNVLAQSAMRKEVGNLELDQLFLEREKLNAGIANALDEASQPWGIRVYRYEIADIHVDRGST